MRRYAVVACGSALLVLGNVVDAQTPGVTREMINTVLPLEGAPLAIPGPYDVTSHSAFDAPGLVAFHPVDLDPFPSRDTLPVMVWGNGGCAVNSSRYGGFLTTIASHGFLVLATSAVPGESGRRTTADDLRAAIDWAEAENVRTGSPLRGKLTIDQVAVMGQSCGGALSITLGADPRVDTIGVFNAGLRSAEGDAGGAESATAQTLAKIHGPVLLINGHERDFMMAVSHANFEMIGHVPVFYGARHNAGHTATVDHPGGGEYANVASNWLLFQFKHDEGAAAMFVGAACELCTNPNWDTDSKGLASMRPTSSGGGL